MPLFYFDYTDDDGYHRDNEGSDLPSFEKAHDLALGKLHAISTASLRSREERESSVAVRDHTGKTLCRATMTVRAKVLD